MVKSMTTDAGILLAVDAGQTGIKMRLTGAGGPLELEASGVRTHEPLLPQLADAVRTAVRKSGASPAVIAIGTTGLTTLDFDAGALRRLLGDDATGRLLLAHDSVTSFLGTLGDRRGAVVAAGTGVVTLAVGRSTVARVDGWGHIMGDAGSGYWIGREALDAVMRAHDGRGPATTLADAARERWPDLEQAYIELQNDPDRVAVVAGFAEAVDELAETDAVAAGISRRAARELAHSVEASLARVATAGDDDVLVSAIGGVFRSRVLRAGFEGELARRVPGVRIEQSHGTGLDGAAALTLLAADHPLRSLIATAGR